MKEVYTIMQGRKNIKIPMKCFGSVNICPWNWYTLHMERDFHR